MSVRNLEYLFKPRSIVLIGASARPGSVGAVLARNLLTAGFAGPILPVHPRHAAIQGVLAYKSIDKLPTVPDLAVIATPPDTVPELVGRLAAKGTRAAVVITAGFGEGGAAQGQALRQAMLDAARPHLMRIVGPNCVGILVPDTGLNASFAHVPAIAGDVAFVTQSGAVATTVLDWARARRVGFSHVVSLGDMTDVDFGDMLDYLAADRGTRAILLYVEAITHARKFMSAARAAARGKLVVAIKAGRHPEGAKAASSHTGALAGTDAVLDAAFRRAGILRVRDLEELFDAAETLARGHRPGGDRLAIVTNGGGLGVIATDRLMDQGGHLADLKPDTLAALDKVLPRTWSHGNPIDIIGDADGARYTQALDALKTATEVDAVLAINCPTAVASGTDAARAVLAAAPQLGRPLLTSWVGETAASEARGLFHDAGIPTYDTPDQAVRGFMHLVQYRRNQDQLMETPPSVPDFPTDAATARKIVRGVLAEGRSLLTEPEAKALLSAYGIPVVPTERAADPDAAAAAAASLATPVALKILSPDITHKSDVGGVLLDLVGADAVRDAARRMLERVRGLHPEARIDGFTVQPMVRRPAAHELIVGLSTDPLFGPVVLFGQGGVAVERIDDKALALPPLNINLAREMMSRTRVIRLLEGYRDRPAAALDTIALTLIQVAQLAADVAEIVELDINPLLADPMGVIALDARVKVAPASGPPQARLAIRPYPRELESETSLADGTAIRLRPIRPEDEPALQDYAKRLDPEDVRLRFFTPLRELSHSFAARLTQIDYDRAMAIVAFAAADGAMLGVARISADPDNTRAEFAVSVRSDLKGRGLGRLLMQRIIEIARARGIARIEGEILRENTAMQTLARDLGFALTTGGEPGSSLTMALSLTPAV